MYLASAAAVMATKTMTGDSPNGFVSEYEYMTRVKFSRIKQMEVTIRLNINCGPKGEMSPLFARVIDTAKNVAEIVNKAGSKPKPKP